MAFGVDVLGTLTEKLKQLLGETGVHYDSFVELTKQYKQGGITEDDFFSKILSYTVNISALNFLAIRVVLELRSALEKGTSFKDAGGLASSPASGPNLGGSGLAALRLPVLVKMTMSCKNNKECKSLNMFRRVLPRRLTKRKAASFALR